MPDVVRFVRQLSHDLRNHLNAAELQSAYVSELAEDAELKSEVKRLRGMIGEMSGALQRLTSLLTPVKLNTMPYEAVAFVEDLQQKLASQSPTQSGAIDWSVNLADASLNIDPQLLQEAFLELIGNAFQHGRVAGQLCASAEVKSGEFVFKLQEPKESFAKSTEHWGREPFQKVSHGHYGLGLHRARNIIETQRGRLDVRYDEPSSSLVTQVALPLANGG